MPEPEDVFRVERLKNRAILSFAVRPWIATGVDIN
jgi:hypothetical protein